MEATSQEQTSPEAPTRQLVAGAIADRCANCGTPLAPDQRYCISCGERRGRPRFPVPAAGPSPAVAAPPPPAPRPRLGASSAFVAGIGVLLLAMGVGVLIGSLAGGGTQTVTQASNKPIIVRVGAGASSNTGASGNSGNSGATGGGKGHKGRGARGRTAKTVKITKVVQQRAAAAASKVLGGSNKLPPPTVQPGGSCAPGSAGCSSSGKFTGNFFGNSGG